MRGININSDQLSNYKPGRDDHTPNGGISSSISANITSSQKKSVDSTSHKGSSLSMKAKFQNQASKTKKAQTKSTAHKITQSLMKPLSGMTHKSRQTSNIHQAVPKTAAYTMMLSQNGFDDVTSNGSLKRTTSKTKDKAQLNSAKKQSKTQNGKPVNQKTKQSQKKHLFSVD